MDSYPSKFVDLLTSQQTVSFGNYEVSEASNFDGDTGPERRERHKWTPKDDVLLISSWLNTSKDPLIGNEQKSVAFWSRITAYFQASAKEADCAHMEANQLKHRWHRINDIVSKFCGAYDAATREKSSGQNENDVLKLAHQIFYNNQKKKFNLEHAWRELRNDQKWCDLTTAKSEGTSKKRKCDDGADSSTSQATANKRPPGVKSAKASGKKKVVDENAVNERLSKFENMFTIKERLTKMTLLDSLIRNREEGLGEDEEALRKKLIKELMST
ncbi:glutathione S-transferase T3-like [Brassica napus]|uniref:glutathione S-transferase T3-like n=1 Tax=Brassica napus TaxID=3708 RepID=UPI0006AAD445|nr:glutathione S-transferase T3-like [Brassica napus]